MNYFNINYDKLQKLKQTKFIYFILIFLILLLICLILSLRFSIYHKIKVYGIYEEDILKVNLNIKLSDKLKTSKYLKFNSLKTNFKIKSYGEYEIINGEIYQDILITTDKKFNYNEIGEVTFYYNKQKILNYIFELFK